MIRLITLFLLCLSTARAIAQNLVPNSSFEEVTKSQCQFTAPGDNIRNYLKDWYAPTSGTADVWTLATDTILPQSCSQRLQSNSPQPRSGRCCAGLYIYYTSRSDNISPYREYIQVKLSEPLRRGKTYRAEFYVALLPSLSSALSSNIGLFFSNDSLTKKESTGEFGPLLAEQPQVNLSMVATQTDKWFKVTGCFIAQDDYRFLTIGNFFSNSQTATQNLLSGGTPEAYYLIDDVSVTAVVSSIPQVDLGKDRLLCPNQSLSLSFSDTLNTTYAWQDGTSGTQYNVIESGTYWLSATRDGCTVSDTVRIHIEQPIRLPGDTTLCAGEPLIVKPLSYSDRYVWSTGETTTSTTITKSGTYWVRSSPSHCANADSITITIVKCPGEVPNVITPNGDGKNDQFFVSNIELLPWTLEIYNRWGMQVYFSPAYRNDWEGEGLGTGIYYYLLSNDKLHRRLKGWVQILKEK